MDRVPTVPFRTVQVKLPDPLGQSESFLDFQQQLSRVAPVNRPVLILGERGTGKELAAARLHYLSMRWDQAFVALNCAALAPGLLEAELFGHEAGAFTGAAQRRRGRFEAAHEGTLFLDEIGIIPIEVQEKILRVVEYGAFERVGSSEPTSVDVRIIGATNADMPRLVSEGKFKSDLLDRLAFEVLTVPPLRDRHGDIPLLARHFAARMAAEIGRTETPEFTDSILGRLEEYTWPGNVRELKNVIERAVYRATGKVIDSVQFDPFAVRSSAPHETPAGAAAATWSAAFPLAQQTLPAAMRGLEISALRAALLETRYNQREAARLLGLRYYQFRALYRKHKAELLERSGEAPPHLGKST